MTRKYGIPFGELVWVETGRHAVPVSVGAVDASIEVETLQTNGAAVDPALLGPRLDVVPVALASDQLDLGAADEPREDLAVLRLFAHEGGVPGHRRGAGGRRFGRAAGGVVAGGFVGLALVTRGLFRMLSRREERERVGDAVTAVLVRDVLQRKACERVRGALDDALQRGRRHA